MTPLRVAIVEDNPQLRAEFTRLVDDAGDMKAVGTYGTAEEALEAVPGAAADVVLMDINLPGMTGIECVRRLRAASPQPHVVMLTAFDDS